MLTDEQVSEVLNVALMIFCLEGMDRARLANMAEMAGISVAELSGRFSTPEQILRVIVTQAIIEPMARATAELPVGSAADQLRNYCGRAWEIINTPRFARVYHLLIAEATLHPALAMFFAEEVADPICRQIGAIISTGITRGEFRVVPTASAASAIFASLVTQAFWCNHENLSGYSFCGHSTRVVPETVGLLLNGLSQDGRAAILNQREN
jgi:hypothetical protein